MNDNLEKRRHIMPMYEQQADSSAHSGADEEARESRVSSDSAVQCPKCGFTSGDDWKQCQGSCPMSASPHYSATLALENRVKELEALVLLLPGVVTSEECNVCEQPKYKLHLWHCVDRNPDLYRQPDGSTFQSVSVKDSFRTAGIAEASRCVHRALWGGSLTERLLGEYLTNLLEKLARDVCLPR